jgi:hypothetical protein
MKRKSIPLALALAAVGTVSYAPLAQAQAAPPPECEVVNAHNHKSYSTLQGAIEAPETEEGTR